MNKQKSVLVTAIIFFLTAVIALAAYKLSTPVFILLVSVFSAVGFASSAVSFCRWLEKEPTRTEEPIEPLTINAHADDTDSETFGFDAGQFSATYEEIKKEMEENGEY